MIQWEHKVITVEGGGKKIQDVLNNASRDGWEACGITSYSDAYLILLKRPYVVAAETPSPT